MPSTNIVSRLFQAGRNTVKWTDFVRHAEDARRYAALDLTQHVSAKTPPVADAAEFARPPLPAPTPRIENYLTEALCVLIWQDPEPFMRVLAEAGVAGSSGNALAVEPLTQQRVVGCKVANVMVDLVLLLDGADTIDEVWIEVKAGATAHGTQMEDYQAAIDHAQDGRVRSLVVLDRAFDAPIKGATRITWQQLLDSLREDDPRAWRDFGAFLVERKQATGPQALLSEAVAPTELAAIVARVLCPQDGLPDWLAWKGPQRIATNISTQFKALGQRAARRYAPHQYTHVDVGLYATPVPSYGVRLGVTRWYPIGQGALRSLVRDASLDARTWTMPSHRDDDAVVAAYVPVGDVPGDPAEWMVARLRELQSQGLLVDLDAHGAVQSATRQES